MHEDEFERLYRTHVDSVFRYCLKAVGNRALAEDITSEVFLELYKRKESLQRLHLPAWLFTVAKNRAVDHWRRSEVEKQYVEMSCPKPEEPSKFDVVAWLRDETRLKPIHRTCLLLHFVHGMSRAEIAVRLSINEMQVKGHLQYGVKLLRKAAEAAEWTRQSQ